MRVRTILFCLGSFCLVASHNSILYPAALSQSVKPATSGFRQEDFRSAYDEKTTRMISEKLVKLISRKACISRLKLGISNTTALSASRAEVLQSYPVLAASVPPISLQSIEGQYRKTCKPLFQKEIVLQLPEEAIPKPVKVEDHADPTSCRVDSYWLNRLMTTAGLYLENKECLFDVRR